MQCQFTLLRRKLDIFQDFYSLFQSLSFGLEWCRILLSDEISQLNHHISSKSPISCRSLSVRHPVTPIRTAQPRLGIDFSSVNSFRCAESHMFLPHVYYPQLLSLTVSAQPHHVPMGSPLICWIWDTEDPSTGKGCSQGFRVTHSPVLP